MISYLRSAELSISELSKLMPNPALASACLTITGVQNLLDILLKDVV